MTGFVIEPWHWLILAFLLFGLEALGAAGFMLGGAIAALLMALFTLLVAETGWAVQLTLFGALGLLFTLICWRWLRRSGRRDDHPQLNQRAAQLIGRMTELEEDLPSGYGRIQMGDTLWKVRAEGPLKKGTRVTVIGSDGMTLLIEAN